MISGFQEISRWSFLPIGRSFGDNGHVFTLADCHNRGDEPIASPGQRLYEAGICG
jgi:hypothetical protein